MTKRRRRADASFADFVLGTPDLRGFWSLGETSGTVARDGLGLHNGTYVGAPTLGVVRPGAADRAATFNGTSQSITVATATSLHPGDTMSLMCWFKRSATQSANQYLVDFGPSDALLWFPADNHLNFAKEGVATIWATSATTTDTNWHHVVVSKAGATFAFYIDGVAAAGTFTNAALVSAVSSIGIAAVFDASSLWFPGSMDDVAIWGRALSAGEVAELYGRATGG